MALVHIWYSTIGTESVLLTKAGTVLTLKAISPCRWVATTFDR